MKRLDPIWILTGITSAVVVALIAVIWIPAYLFMRLFYPKRLDGHLRSPGGWFGPVI